MYPFVYMRTFSGVKLLGHMWIFNVSSYCQTVVKSIVYESTQCSTILPMLNFLRFLNLCQSGRFVMPSHCVLICIQLITSELSIFSYVYSTILYSKCFLVFPFTIKVFNLLGIDFHLRYEVWGKFYSFFHKFTPFIENLSYPDLRHYISEVLGIHVCMGLFLGLLLFHLF